MTDLIDNGYIMQRKVSICNRYGGIDGENWYLNYCSNDAYFNDFFCQYIDKSWEKTDYVDCCRDEEYIQSYIDESKKLGIEFRILLCATCREQPRLEKKISGYREKFLGYDYAYAGGSYYSAILNEIVSEKITEFQSINLNEYGLFSDYEDVLSFISIRDRKKIVAENELEKGDFIIYRIFELYV